MRNRADRGEKEAHGRTNPISFSSRTPLFTSVFAGQSGVFTDTDSSNWTSSAQ
jgi:hypothetical protein